MNATEQWPTHLELFGHTAHGVGRAFDLIDFSKIYRADDRAKTDVRSYQDPHT